MLNDAPKADDCPPHVAHVLVVDDHDLIRETLTDLLTGSGYRTRAAGSGDEALRLLDDEGACVVIADWEMPGMNGLELVRRLRGDGRYSNSYVIMYTGRQEPGDRIACTDAGADDLLTKYEPLDQLLDHVRRGCTVAAQRRCAAG